MPEQPTSLRVLFVDDEASIRLTLPPVLEKAGFKVHVAATVSDALFEINSNKFEILISDLNIGEEGDGFLVTSAMRHVQPQCLTFILTGYPAFETALQAIHNHVDDYLVKPVDIGGLTKTLKQRVTNRGSKPAFGMKRLGAVLKENQQQILDQMANAHQNGKPGHREDLKRSISNFFTALIDQLQGEEDQLSADALRSASAYGAKCKRENCSLADLAADFRSLEQGAYRAVQNNMVGMDIPTLISDLRKFSLGVHTLMELSIEGYSQAGTETAKANPKPLSKSTPARR